MPLTEGISLKLEGAAYSDYKGLHIMIIRCACYDLSHVPSLRGIGLSGDLY